MAALWQSLCASIGSTAVDPAGLDTAFYIMASDSLTGLWLSTVFQPVNLLIETADESKYTDALMIG